MSVPALFNCHLAFHGEGASGVAIDRVMVDRPVELLDLAPTVLSLLEIEPPPEWRGIDLGGACVQRLRPEGGSGVEEVRVGKHARFRIPLKHDREEVRVVEGSVVDLSMENGNLVVKVTEPDRVDLEDLLEKITDDNIHEEIDPGDAVGGEVW